MKKIIKKQKGKKFSEQFGFPMPLGTIPLHKDGKVVAYEFT